MSSSGSRGRGGKFRKPKRGGGYIVLILGYVYMCCLGMDMIEVTGHCSH